MPGKPSDRGYFEQVIAHHIKVGLAADGLINADDAWTAAQCVPGRRPPRKISEILNSPSSRVVSMRSRGKKRHDMPPKPPPPVPRPPLHAHELEPGIRSRPRWRPVWPATIFDLCACRYIWARLAVAGDIAPVCGSCG